MNKLLGEKYLEITGLNNALEVARILIKNGYQVMIQNDITDTDMCYDDDIFVVAFAQNQEIYGDSRFALLTPDEIEYIAQARGKN